MNSLVKRFNQLGQDASFHFADDTTKEWSAGFKLRALAMDIYNAHPELHEEMNEAAKDFLWSLDIARKETNGR